MSTNLKATVMIVVLVCMATALGGCILAAAGAGAAGVVYLKGEMSESVTAEPQAVADATAKAFESLNITLISSKVSGTEGEVKGRTATDTAVSVGIKTKGEGVSEVTVRFGTIGDKDQNRVLMDEIKKNL